MVFFTCNACGQAIKKAQVEKHYQQRCRSCEVLSCMDCGKDFYGDEYKQHTQCISEDQKYGGKGYQAPQNSNKGEAKQEQWLLRVREAVGAGNISSNIKNLLEQIAEYPNVPRKKSKFENFVRNSLKVHHPKTIEQVWDVFSAATAKPDASKSTQPVPKETSEAQGTVSPNSVPDGGVQEQEIKEKAEEMKVKKKKRKHEETDAQPGDQNGTSSTEPPSPKKAKKTSKEKRKKTSTEKPEKTATEKVEETSIESSTKEVKKKKKQDDGDQESSDVKKKKKRKHKETNGQLADVSGNSLAETSPKRAKKNSIESSPEKAKKKKKKKKQSSGDCDHVASSEMNGSKKAGNKTKSERKEDASSNKTKVTNGLTSLPSVPSDQSATSKKKKKSKKRTLISDSNKPDALSIDGSKKMKKKTKKEKRDSGSEKGSPVKTGTKLKKQGVVVKSMEEENGLGTTEVKKSKKGSKKSKDLNNNPVSFSTISPSNESIKTKSKSPEKKKKSHKKDKSKESSDKSGIAEAKNEIKKVRKSKKVKIK